MIGAKIGTANIAIEVLVCVLVAQSRNGALAAADFMSQTLGAVDDGVVAAVGFAAGRNFVFTDSGGGLMGELIQCAGFKGIAASAAAAFLPLGGAVWLHSHAPLTEVVTLCGDSGLLGQHRAAYRAVLAFREAACGAGGGDRTVNNNGVPRCGDGGLLGDDEAAYRAVLTFCQTVGGTGSCNGLVSDCGVSLSGNDGLGSDDFPAVGAFFAVGETIGGAGGCVTLDGDQGMVGTQIGGANVADKVLVLILVSQGRCGALGAADLMGFAYFTVDNLLIAARSFAGGGYGVFCHRTVGCVGELGDALDFLIATFMANAALAAHGGAGGSLGDRPRAVAVAVGGDVAAVVPKFSAGAEVSSIALLCAGGSDHGGIDIGVGDTVGNAVDIGVLLPCGAAVNIKGDVGAFIKVLLADGAHGAGDHDAGECGAIAEGVFLDGLHALLDVHGF